MKTFLSSRKESFRYAFAGMAYVLKTQKNAWIHLLITLAVFILGIILNLELIHWSVIVISIAMVWISELLNTSLEATIDLISPTDHPLAKICKDVAAAAVLISAICSVIVGLLILGPPLLNLLLLR